MCARCGRVMDLIGPLWLNRLRVGQRGSVVTNGVAQFVGLSNGERVSVGTNGVAPVVSVSQSIRWTDRLFEEQQAREDAFSDSDTESLKSDPESEQSAMPDTDSDF